MRNDNLVATFGVVEVRTGDWRQYEIIRSTDGQLLGRINDEAAAKARAAEISAAMVGAQA